MAMYAKASMGALDVTASQKLRAAKRMALKPISHRRSPAH
jgi:hypothetical protein